MAAVSLYLLWATPHSRPAVLLLIPATMFARIYFGAHWLGDTIAGGAVGAAVAAGVHALLGAQLRAAAALFARGAAA